MIEKPFFFPNAGCSLFGVLHEPESGTARTPFVFVHPFAEEKLWTHRVFVTFARELARRGHAVLRFDLMGNGDSQGGFEETSLESSLSDLRCAISLLKRRTGSAKVSLLGLRLGALLACLEADARDDVRHLVLWAPIVHGGRYMQEMLRINIATQMAVYKEVRQDRGALVARMKEGGTANVDGYPLSYPFYEQLSAVALADRPRTFDGPCLIVQLDRQEGARPLPELEQLRDRFTGATMVTVQEEPFWKEIERFYETAPNLFATTLEWLETR